MIKIDSSNGELQARGHFDTILCEWTLLTRVIIKEVKEQFPEEVANELIAGLGQIAAKNPDEVHNVTKLFNEIEEVLDEVPNEA